MNIRCSYCRQSFNLSREYVAQAIEKASAKRHKYHTVECINCRKMIKVPIAQMKRFVPQESTASAGETSSADQT